MRVQPVTASTATLWWCENCQTSGLVTYEQHVDVYSVFNGVRDAHAAAAPECKTQTGLVRIASPVDWFRECPNVDSELIDALQTVIRANGGLVIHEGDYGSQNPPRYPGLGITPGVKRTLREALASLLPVAKREELSHNAHMGKSAGKSGTTTKRATTKAVAKQSRATASPAKNAVRKGPAASTKRAAGTTTKKRAKS